MIKNNSYYSKRNNHGITFENSRMKENNRRFGEEKEKLFRCYEESRRD